MSAQDNFPRPSERKAPHFVYNAQLFSNAWLNAPLLRGDEALVCKLTIAISTHDIRVHAAYIVEAIESMARGLPVGALIIDTDCPTLRDARVAQWSPENEKQGSGYLLDDASRQMPVNDVRVKLTPDEYRVLKCRMEQGSRALSKQTMISALFPSEDCSPNVLEEYISRLRNKLSKANVHIRSIRPYRYSIEIQQ
jgi:hypothetical protein